MQHYEISSNSTTHCSHFFSTDTRTLCFSYSPAGEKCQVIMPADRRRNHCLQTPDFIIRRTTASTLMLLVLEGAYT